MTNVRNAGLYLVMLLSTGRVVSSGPYACEPDPGVRDELLRIELSWCEPSRPCFSEQQRKVEALLAEHPDDLHVRRLAHSLDSYAAHRDDDAKRQFEEKYARLHESDPGDPVAFLLYIESLDIHREDVPALYDELVAQAPDFIWGRLGRIRARSTVLKGEVDDTMREDMRAALEACPDSARVLSTAAVMFREQDLWVGRVPGLREALLGATPLEQTRNLPRLWSMEFKAADESRHHEVRERVRADLERLEAYHLEGFRGWWRALRTGYEQLADSDALEALKLREAERLPCDHTAVMLKLESWPQGELDDISREELHRLVDLTDEWLKECPNDYSYATSRFEALAELASRGSVPGLSRAQAGPPSLNRPKPEVGHSELDHLTDEALLHEIERYLDMWETQRGYVYPAKTPNLLAARLLLRRDLDPERALRLLAKERDHIERRRKQQPLSVWAADLRPRLQQYQLLQDSDVLALEAEAEVKRGRLAEAERILAAIPVRIEAIDVPEMDPYRRKTEGLYWQLRAAIALNRDRRLDGLGYFLKAESVDPELGEQLRAASIWTELGGDEEAWAVLRAAMGSVEEAQLGWEETDDPLADFELKDLKGRSWRSLDLRGKALLLNVWTTWCGPCKVELPFVQRLAERVAGRSDMVVMTLNIDDNPGLVAPFVEREGLELTVLLGKQYWESIHPSYVMVPQTWLVDPDGMVRKARVGFVPESERDRWVEQALAALEELASAGGGPPSSN